MSIIHSENQDGISITMGQEPINLNVAGIFVRNGLDEIKGYIQTEGKAELQEIIRQSGADFDAQINAYNDNAFWQTELFNQNALEQSNYVAEEAIYWATAPIDENPMGSAKYWAEQAKINYQEALALTDTINNEEV